MAEHHPEQMQSFTPALMDHPCSLAKSHLHFLLGRFVTKPLRGLSGSNCWKTRRCPKRLSWCA